MTIGEPTVFVVDEDASVLRALSWLLSFEFTVRAYDSPSLFLEAIRPETPGCIRLRADGFGQARLDIETRNTAKRQVELRSPSSPAPPSSRAFARSLKTA